MVTCELKNTALDWAVAKCEGVYLAFPTPLDAGCVPFKPSTNWLQGGPILERELHRLFRNVGGTFTAQIKRRVPYYSPTYDADIGMDETISRSGPTMLIAAMRCYVASKLGDEVEVPGEVVCLDDQQLNAAGVPFLERNQ